MTISTSDIAFHRRLGNLLDALAGEDFWPTFGAFLRDHIGFTTWVVVIFRAGQVPLLVHEGDTDAVEDKAFRDYLIFYYADDPFYQFSQGHFTPGLYRLDEVATPQFHASAYCCNYLKSVAIADEMQLLCPYGDAGKSQGVLSLSLGADRRFSTAEYGALALISPWLMPLLGLASRRLLGDVKLPADGAQMSRIEQRLRAFERPKLTEREVQTALLILSGQSTKGIAAQMGISPETIKVHRRNLYDKLGVASQLELFALYTAMGE